MMTNCLIGTWKWTFCKLQQPVYAKDFIWRRLWYESWRWPYLQKSTKCQKIYAFETRRKDWSLLSSLFVDQNYFNGYWTLFRGYLIMLGVFEKAHGRAANLKNSFSDSGLLKKFIHLSRWYQMVTPLSFIELFCVLHHDHVYLTIALKFIIGQNSKI